MNPLDEFLIEKNGGMFQNANKFPGAVGDALLGGAATAVAGGIIGGVGFGAKALYEAATKGRDFRRMMSGNPDLMAEHEKDPKGFNQLYSSLRGVNTAFFRDPVIVGTYMRRMVGSFAVGGVLIDVLGFQGKDQ